MGRSPTKLPLQLIKNEKARNVTFRKRKKGLIKKTYELKSLCDVQCSVIIYENKPNGQLRPETFPENPEEVKKIIDRFVSKSAKVRKIETLSDYFGKQIMQMKKETARLQQKNTEARFPSWDDRLDDFSTDQLLDLIEKLNHKIKDVHQRFDKHYAIEEASSIIPQTALFPNNMDYSQMVALNQYSPTGGSMMYISERAFSEEKTNLQALWHNNYHHNYNNSSIMMNRNGMPWHNYNIQSAPSTSNVLSYDEFSTSMKFENRMQYGNIDDNLTLCNHVPLQAAYPMSASYLFDNANFFHLKGQ